MSACGPKEALPDCRPTCRRDSVPFRGQEAPCTLGCKHTARAELGHERPTADHQSTAPCWIFFHQMLNFIPVRPLSKGARAGAAGDRADLLDAAAGVTQSTADAMTSAAPVRDHYLGDSVFHEERSRPIKVDLVRSFDRVHAPPGFSADWVFGLARSGDTAATGRGCGGWKDGGAGAILDRDSFERRARAA
jgi:hypothetical protein